MKKLLWLAVTAFSCITSLAAQQRDTLRIGLWTLWHDREVEIAPAGGTIAIRTCQHCTPRPLTRETKLYAEGDTFTFDGKRTASLWLDSGIVISAHNERLTLSYPLHFTAHNNTLTMAVIMPVEHYVERVVASESGAGDSQESLKVLAIVVRSFALHVRHGHAEYNLCDATHCQLLHWGTTGREAAAHAATLATTGETLWFHGKRAEAWFHQNCGGHTASATEVWGAKDSSMPWLVGHVDPYCAAHGEREWSQIIPLHDLTQALASQGLVAPGWKMLSISHRGGSGRAVILKVGATAISAEDFRLAVGRTLGWNKIPSAWFEVTQQGEEFHFHGRGSGHGVGLCQVGSAAMAAHGLKVDAILAQYFPGAEVRDEASGLRWQRSIRSTYIFETLDETESAYLPQIDQAIAEAQSRSGLHFRETITIRSFRSAPEFRATTLAPGWVAAFTEAGWIGMQPLRVLASRKILLPVLRHEMLHVLVESNAGRKAAPWLREGLVEVWNSDTKPSERAPRMTLDEINRALVRPNSEVESEAAHQAAQMHASELLSRYSRTQVLDWLHNGVPASASAH